MILAFTGPKFSGKTTAADVAVERGFKKVSFAQPLRELASECLEINMIRFTDPELKEKPFNAPIQIEDQQANRIMAKAHLNLHRINTACRVVSAAKMQTETHEHPLKTPREVLQYLGTEIFRETVDENYWLRVAESRLMEDDNFVIDDARFENEIRLIKELGGVVVGIRRDGYSDHGDCHASEKDNSNLSHIKLYNDSLNLFQNSVDKLVDCLGG